MASSFLILSLFREQLYALLLIAVLLFPIVPFWMQNSLGHPYLAQFFFSFLALFLVKNRSLNLSIRLLSLPWVLVLAIWSSEMSVVFVLALLLVEFRSLISLGWKNLYLLPGLLGGALFLYLAKEQAVPVETYAQLFAAPDDIFISLKRQGEDILELLSFQGNKNFNAVLAIALISTVPILLFLYRKSGTKLSKLLLIFALTALGSWFLVHISHWNTAMYMPQRYFTSAYFFGIVTLILAHKELRSAYPFLKVPAVIIVGMHLNASYQAYKRFDTGAFNRVDRGQAEYLIREAREERGLDRLAVIGSYWNTYLLDGLSEQVIAIPRKGDQVRDYRVLPEIKAQEHFLIIANDWLETMPDTLNQYQISMQRNSEVFQLDEIKYAYYQKTSPPTQNKLATLPGPFLNK